MASSKEYAIQQATRAAQTNKPAPVYKPTTSYVVKQAGTAAYNTARTNQGKK